MGSLARYRGHAPHAVRARPTDEHFLPLLVAIGASIDGEPRRLIEGGKTCSVLSMDVRLRAAGHR